MFDLIVRLRARPLAYRRKVAWWSTVAITSIVALIWALSLSVRFDDANFTAEGTDAPGPFETFMGQVQAGADALKDSMAKKDF